MPLATSLCDIKAPDKRDVTSPIARYVSTSDIKSEVRADFGSVLAGQLGISDIQNQPKADGPDLGKSQGIEGDDTRTLSSVSRPPTESVDRDASRMQPPGPQKIQTPIKSAESDLAQAVSKAGSAFAEQSRAILASLVSQVGRPLSEGTPVKQPPSQKIKSQNEAIEPAAQSPRQTRPESKDVKDSPPADIHSASGYHLELLTNLHPESEILIAWNASNDHSLSVNPATSISSGAKVGGGVVSETLWPVIQSREISASQLPQAEREIKTSGGQERSVPDASGDAPPAAAAELTATSQDGQSVGYRALSLSHGQAGGSPDSLIGFAQPHSNMKGAADAKILRNSISSIISETGDTINASEPTFTSKNTAPVSHTDQTSDVDPFQRLDSGISSGTVLHVASNRVEIGVHDPAMGWLEIKTQSNAGQISAALVATSSESHANLAAQLPLLNQYLSDHEVKVNHIGVEQHPTGISGDRDATSRQDSRSGERGREHRPPSTPEGEISLLRSPSGWNEDLEVSPLSYISVHA